MMVRLKETRCPCSILGPLRTRPVFTWRSVNRKKSTRPHEKTPHPGPRGHAAGPSGLGADAPGPAKRKIKYIPHRLVIKPSPVSGCVRAVNACGENRPGSPPSTQSPPYPGKLHEYKRQAKRPFGRLWSQVVGAVRACLLANDVHLIPQHRLPRTALCRFRVGPLRSPRSAARLPFAWPPARDRMRFALLFPDARLRRATPAGRLVRGTGLRARVRLRWRLVRFAHLLVVPPGHRARACGRVVPFYARNHRTMPWGGSLAALGVVSRGSPSATVRGGTHAGVPRALRQGQE